MANRSNTTLLTCLLDYSKYNHLTFNTRRYETSLDRDLAWRSRFSGVTYDTDANHFDTLGQTAIRVHGDLAPFSDDDNG